MADTLPQTPRAPRFDPDAFNERLESVWRRPGAASVAAVMCGAHGRADGPAHVEAYKATKLREGQTSKSVNSHLCVIVNLAVEWGELSHAPRVNGLDPAPRTRALRLIASTLGLSLRPDLVGELGWRQVANRAEACFGCSPAAMDERKPQLFSFAKKAAALRAGRPFRTRLESDVAMTTDP